VAGAWAGGRVVAISLRLLIMVLRIGVKGWKGEGRVTG
jgi:hypothetical protein